MSTGANQMDRLLPRHDSEPGLDLVWNVRLERSGLFKTKKDEEFSAAKIQDLSLEGALVRVPAGEGHEVGSLVDVRFRGKAGHAKIRHSRPGPQGSVLYGVKFLPEAGFGDVIIDAVGEMRGHSAELSVAWNRNR